MTSFVGQTTDARTNFRRHLLRDAKVFKDWKINVRKADQSRIAREYTIEKKQ